jgi:folate-binding protein YgfZ
VRRTAGRLVTDLIVTHLNLGCVTYGKGPLTAAILDDVTTTVFQHATQEQQAVRHGCGLVDRSERGKLALTGSETKVLLQGQVTNDVEGLTPGSGCYAALLTPKGKMLGDLRILDTGEELWLDTERGALQAIFNALYRARIGFDAAFHKRTLERGLLSLIGPQARHVAGAAAEELGTDEHANTTTAIDDIPVLVIVTDVGLDLVCAAGETAALVAALTAHGARVVAEAAAECLRIEHGRPRYGLDLDESTIPQEAGLNERAVSFTKGCYVGQETVARLHYKGKPNRHLRGVRLSAPLPTGTELSLDGKVVGTLGSVANSPAHGPIGLALVRREAPPGTRLAAADASAEVVELPFTSPSDAA